ncbi:hypothetical protein, partial [Deinococcus marmoris]|uniref:hypothetical protein n=1 Tax=Deinococcus marmoris TaxID=249408 RepID=UPI0039EFCB8E
ARSSACGGKASFQGQQSQFKLVKASLKDQAIGAKSVLDAPTLSDSTPQVPLLSSYAKNTVPVGAPEHIRKMCVALSTEAEMRDRTASGGCLPHTGEGAPS